MGWPSFHFTWGVFHAGFYNRGRLPELPTEDLPVNGVHCATPWTTVSPSAMEEAQGDMLRSSAWYYGRQPGVSCCSRRAHAPRLPAPCRCLQYLRSSQTPLLRSGASYSFSCNGSSARSIAASCLPKSFRRNGCLSLGS